MMTDRNEIYRRCLTIGISIISIGIAPATSHAQGILQASTPKAGQVKNGNLELNKTYEMSPPEEKGPPQPEKCIVDDPGNRTHWIGVILAFGATGQYGAEYAYSTWQRQMLKTFNCAYAHMSVGVGGYILRNNGKFRGAFPFLSYEAKGYFSIIGASIQPRLGVVLNGDEVTPAAAVSVSFTTALTFVDIGYTLQVSLGKSQPPILAQHLLNLDFNIPIVNAGTMFPDEPE